jgi:hypothetical protein
MAMKCMDRVKDDYNGKEFGAFAVTGGRVLTKVQDAREKYEESAYNQYLGLTEAPFDIIESHRETYDSLTVFVAA